jgi:hypothetical protein
MLSGRRRRQVDEIRVLSLRAQWRIPQWTRALCLSFGLSRLRLSKRWWTAEFGPFGQGTAPPPPPPALRMWAAGCDRRSPLGLLMGMNPPQPAATGFCGCQQLKAREEAAGRRSTSGREERVHTVH